MTWRISLVFNTDLYLHFIIGNDIGGYFLGEDRKFFSPLGIGHELHFHASFGIVEY